VKTVSSWRVSADNNLGQTTGAKDENPPNIFLIIFEENYRNFVTIFFNQFSIYFLISIVGKNGPEFGRSSKAVNINVVLLSSLTDFYQFLTISPFPSK
jgi:hypothetical protein